MTSTLQPCLIFPQNYTRKCFSPRRQAHVFCEQAAFHIPALQLQRLVAFFLDPIQHSAQELCSVIFITFHLRRFSFSNDFFFAKKKQVINPTRPSHMCSRKPLAMHRVPTGNLNLSKQRLSPAASEDERLGAKLDTVVPL